MEQRLIDANALKEQCFKFADDVPRWAMAFAQGQINCAPTIDAVPVVRCKDCQWFKPAHFKAGDGTEHHWDDSFFIVGRTDGIYIGAKCKHERNTAYGEKDMAFRRPTDFCSYGERRDSDD